MLFLSAPHVLYAQENLVQTDQTQEANEAQKAIEEGRELRAVPGKDRSVQVGRQILFDGSASTNSEEGSLRYVWDFGDGVTAVGVDVTHAYSEPGDYVVSLTVDNGTEEDTSEITVSVFEELIVLVTDGSPSSSAIESYEFNAAREGILLVVLEYASSEPEYIIEEELSELLIENVDDIAKTDVIITSTTGSTGLNALSKFAQEAESLEKINMSSKAIVTLSEPSASLARIAQSTFNILRPEYILITNETSLPLIWGNNDSAEIIPAIQKTERNYRIIGTHSERSVRDFKVWNFMSFFVDFMINRGVPVNTIILILLLPIIATLLAFSRQVLGIKAFGIYTPSIITLAFLATGLEYGLLVFLVVLLTGSITRVVLKKFRLLFLPRMAIVLTAVALAVIALLAIGASLNLQALVAVSIFPILIMVTLVEKFVTAQIEKGMWEATKLSIETLILSIIGFFILSWDPLRDFVLAYPEIIIVTIVLNILLGKWTGLRLSEYYRFREVRRYLKD